MIEIKKYYPHANVDFRGNPLCEFMPQPTRERLARLLVSPIECHPHERTHDAQLRIQYVSRFKYYYAPLPDQLEWAEMILNLFLQGYRSRNPLAANASDKLNELCSFIEQDEASSRLLGTNTAVDIPNCVLMMGTPGTGKSITLKSLFSRLPTDVMYHVASKTYQLLSVYVMAPGNGRDSKTLAWTVYDALFTAATKVGLCPPRLSATTSIGVIRVAVSDLVSTLNVGIIIVDELQHAVRGSAGLDNETMKFLTDLVNHMAIPIVLIGTWRVATLLASELRLSRRVISPESARSRRMPDDETYYQFLQGVFKVQFQQTTVECNELYKNVFYHHTQGIQDLTIKLMMLAQIEAIRSGLEVLTPTLVDEVAKEHFELVAPAVRMMREGVRENDPILWDIEPVDFDKYLEALVAESSLQLVGKKRVGAEKLSTIRNKIRAALVVTELASEGTAEVIANAATDAKPTQTAAEHLMDVLKASIPKGPKPTRAKARVAEVDRQFEALDFDDLRKIAYLATRTKSDTAGALTAAGYYAPLLDDVPL